MKKVLVVVCCCCACLDVVQIANGADPENCYLRRYDELSKECLKYRTLLNASGGISLVQDHVQVVGE
jgi:hypothetical protein